MSTDQAHVPVTLGLDDEAPSPLTEALQPPVGSPMVLAAAESDRPTGKTNTILGTLNHVGKPLCVASWDRPGDECEVPQ
jgi:hypothetical protein